MENNVKESKDFLSSLQDLNQFHLSFRCPYLKSSVTSCNGNVHAKVLREKI